MSDAQRHLNSDLEVVVSVGLGVGSVTQESGLPSAEGEGPPSQPLLREDFLRISRALSSSLPLSFLLCKVGTAMAPASPVSGGGNRTCRSACPAEPGRAGSGPPPSRLLQVLPPALSTGQFGGRARSQSTWVQGPLHQSLALRPWTSCLTSRLSLPVCEMETVMTAL